LEASAVGGIEAGFADGDIGIFVAVSVDGAPVGATLHLKFRPEAGSRNYEKQHPW